MRRPNYHLAPPELNITPLVDVMLVLLVVLMLIIPALRYDEDISLPQGSQQKTTAAAATDIRVSVSQSAVLLGGKSYSHLAFYDNLALAAPSMNKSATVYIAADRNIKYGQLMPIIAAFKKLGFAKISLQTR